MTTAVMQSFLLVSTALCAVAHAQTGHVIVIGVDGLGAQAVRENPAPSIHRLMAAGSWTLKARGVMPTVSSPNCASMIMGAGPEQHGVISNEWKPVKFEFSPVCRGLAATFPTIFGILREPKPASRISIFHDWDGFARLVEPGVAAVSESPDGARTAILLTADHGGVGKKHGGNTMAELEIPWIASGAGIVRNHEVSVPVNTYDTAATIATLLNLKPPACWLGRPVNEALAHP